MALENEDTGFTLKSLTACQPLLVAYSMWLLTVIDEALAEVYPRCVGRINLERRAAAPDDILADKVNPLLAVSSPILRRAARRKTHVSRACSFSAANT
jgi:hypothetical protein